MDYKTLILGIDRHIATLTFNRPGKMNAFNKELELEMQDALDQLEQDAAVRAVILAGAGKCFSAGFDLSASSASGGRSVQQWRENIRRENDTWFRIWRSRLPFIAAVHGYCLGGACELSMVCDFTIAGESAQFGEPEIQFQSAASFPIMPWVLGMKKTKALLLTGDRIGAGEALAAGLVTKVVPDDVVMEEAQKLAQKLARIPPPAMQLNKQALNRAYDLRGFTSAIQMGEEFFTLVVTADSEEGREFRKIAAEQGLKAAFKWRDAKFAAGGSAGDLNPK